MCKSFSTFQAIFYLDSLYLFTCFHANVIFQNIYIVKSFSKNISFPFIYLQQMQYAHVYMISWEYRIIRTIAEKFEFKVLKFCVLPRKSDITPVTFCRGFFSLVKRAALVVSLLSFFVYPRRYFVETLLC